MDRNRFCAVWIPLGGRFYRVAYYMLESEESAQDVVQDLYVRLWNARDRLDNVLNPAAYGVALLRNLCLDRIRHAAVARTEPLRSASLAADPEPPPDGLLFSREALNQLNVFIEQLPEKQRTVLKMRIYEGMEYEEISARTGWSGIHLRVLLSTARRNLRKQMEEWK